MSKKGFGRPKTKLDARKCLDVQRLVGRPKKVLGVQKFLDVQESFVLLVKNFLDVQESFVPLVEQYPSNCQMFRLIIHVTLDPGS